MKIFVLDFSGDPKFLEIFPDHSQVKVETQDGAMAYKTVGEQLPSKIFINYRHKPSHGRQTAISIKNRKKTAGIPIFFVDGEELENEKVKGLGNCIRSDEIIQNL